MEKIVYGISLGAGHETMTLQAARLLKEADVIFLSASGSYNNPQEVKAILDGISCGDKLIPITMPASSDKTAHTAHTAKFAEICAESVNHGKVTAYVSMGDITVYSSFADLYKLLQSKGIKLVGISGISAFMAPAISVGTALAQWNDNFCVIPCPHHTNDLARFVENFDTVVVMKIYDGGKIIQDFISQNKVEKAVMVVNAYKPTEKVFDLTKVFPQNEDINMSVVLLKKMTSK